MAVIATSSISPRSLPLRSLQSLPRPAVGDQITATAVAPGDSVSLGSAAPPVPTLPVVPAAPPEIDREIRGSFDLKPADLAKALKDPQARAILESLDPKASLSDLSAVLFKMDPAAASDDSKLQLKYYKGEGWSSVSLLSTRPMSNGKTVSEVQLGASPNRSSDQTPRPRFMLEYRPETFPTYQQLPEVLQKAWSKVFTDSPQEAARDAQELTGDIGKVSNLVVYLGGADSDKPYVSLDWSGKTPEDVITTIQRTPKDLTLSVKLTPEQLKSGRTLPDSVKNGWSHWGLQPEEMAERMMEGANARAKQFQVGLSHGQSQHKVSLGATLVGDVDGKELDAGQVAFSFYDSTDDQGKTSKVAYHNLLNFREQFQGHGLAKSILRNNFDLYGELGIDKVDLTAAITVGGYAWARYGWQLKPDDVKSGRLDKQVAKRLETLDLKAKDRKVVDAILASQDPKKVWALSDLQTPVTKDGKETTLGKALLLGTNWSGTFDMHDPASTERLERYLGKS